MYKILIVDDEKPARELIAEFTRSYLPGSEIFKVDNPQVAMERLLNEDFDLLFIDISMPGMTGLELLEKIRHRGKTPYAILVSAFRKFDYAVKGIELGVKDYLVKPLHREKVYKAVRAFLDKTDNNTILISVPQGSRRIKTEQILAIQTVDRARVQIYTPDELIPSVTGALHKLHPLLPAHFQYIRRNCIVNCHAITEFNLKQHEAVIVCRDRKVTLNVSREKMKELQKIILFLRNETHFINI